MTSGASDAVSMDPMRERILCSVDAAVSVTVAVTLLLAPGILN